MSQYESRESFITHSFSGRTLREFPEYLQALLEVKVAAANANHEAGLLVESDLQKIIAATKKLGTSLLEPQGAPIEPYQGGGGIATHRFVIEAYAKAGVDPLTINLNQSTSDVCATAMHIALWRMTQPLNEQIQRSIAILNDKTKDFSDITTLARTCMQDASTIDMGERFSAFTHRLQCRYDNLKLAQAKLLQVRIGGAVLGNDAVVDPSYKKCVLKHMQDSSGLPLVKSKNFIADTQQPTIMHDLSQSIHACAVEVLRVTKDLRLLASGPKSGSAELHVPKLISGSSFFKNKSNPTLLETVMQAGMLIIGRCRSVDAGVEHAEVDLNVFEQMIALCLYESIHYLTQAHEKLNLYCLDGITVNEAKCAELARHTQTDHKDETCKHLN